MTGKSNFVEPEDSPVSRQCDKSSLLSRRAFLMGAAASIMAPFLPSLPGMEADAWAGLDESSPRTLSFYSPNTRESLTVTYFKNGKYQRGELRKVNRHFRDHYCGRVHMIDPHLLDYLFRIKIDLGVDHPFHILSAYRTPATNNMLRRHSSKVAKHSYHVYGKAVDIRVPGVGTAKLRRAAYRQKLGGVGYYKKARFVHVDTGKFRAWWG